MDPDEKRVIQGAVSRLLEEDYRADFEPLFEHAFQVFGGIPLDASDEIRIVQNHCAFALSRDELREGELEIARAGRHLQQAKYNCLRHMIVGQTKRLSSIVEMERSGDKQFEVRLRIQELEKIDSAIPDLRVKRMATIEEIFADIHAASTINNDLENHVVRINQLLEEISDLYHTSSDELVDSVAHKREAPTADLATKSPSHRASKMAARKPQTKIGRAIVENKVLIAISSTASLLLLDEKLTILRAQLPNSDEARTARDEEIARYELLRRQVDEFRIIADEFARGDTKEPIAVDATKTFSEGVRSWWTERHQQICERTFDLALFASAVGVCSLAGAGGIMSVAVSGALVGGKPVVDVLKSIGKSFSKVRSTGD